LGGAERYSFELARNMAKRVDTTLLTFGKDDQDYRVENLRVRVLGKAWRVRGQEFNRLHWKLPGYITRANIVHCHQQHVLASSLSALTSGLVRAKCFVSDLGGGGWDVSGYISTDGWYRGHLHISEYSRRIFGHEKRANARVVLGGVDLEKFAPDPKVSKEPLVVYAGRLMPHKGIDYLVQGLPKGLRLELIGRPYDREFTAKLRSLAERKNVVFRHDCDDAQLVDAYRRALCVVLPSVYRSSNGAESTIPELLGQTLIEGMSCGTAAICTRVASMPEIVVDGDTGFIVPPNDSRAIESCLTRLAGDYDEAIRLGHNGRLRVESTFTWQSVVDRCINAYTEL
jgi:glycosyltransferase involved in cell wall biosynthesis